MNNKLHVYTGNGKGKTTAAMGLTVLLTAAETVELIGFPTTANFFMSVFFLIFVGT